MAWRDWFDLAFIRHVFRHVSGTIITILLFELTALIVKTFMSVGRIRDGVEGVEGVVLLGLLIILASQLAVSVIKEVWKQTKGGWNGSQVLAF